MNSKAELLVIKLNELQLIRVKNSGEESQEEDDFLDELDKFWYSMPSEDLEEFKKIYKKKEE